MRPQNSHSFPHIDSRRAAPRGALRLRIVLLATSALVSAVLPTTFAHAGDAAWSATPANGDFNRAANWDGNAVPDGNATFSASNIQDIKFNQTTTLGGMAVTSGAGAYTFDTNGQNVTFNGAGLSVQSGASLTLNNGATINGAIIQFLGTSTADQAHITNDGRVYFENSSTAANATIVNHNILNFYDSSTAGNAFIESDGAISL